MTLDIIIERGNGYRHQSCRIFYREHTYEKTTVRLIAFIAEIQKGKISLKDHDMYNWVDINDLKNFCFAPADVPLVEKLLHD